MPSSAGYVLTGKKRPKCSPVAADNCTACGRCKDICPRDAIEIVKGRAKIDYSKCIRCYCCHEFCPYDAIKLEVLK